MKVIVIDYKSDIKFMDWLWRVHTNGFLLPREL